MRKHPLSIQLSLLGLIFIFTACIQPTQPNSIQPTPTTIQQPQPVLANSSFEDNTDGWDNLTVGDSEYFAPVDGNAYAIIAGDSAPTIQETDYIITAGEVYTLTVWARSINERKNTAMTTAEAQFYAGETMIASVMADVNAMRLTGSPEFYPNDDGGNVWIDQGYRMEFADRVFYQLESDDPLADPWSRVVDMDYDTDMAVGQVITPNGLKALYSTYYDDGAHPYSEILLITASGEPPDYTWRQEEVVLSHDGDEEPWTIDAHLTFDEETGRLWMTWGGGTVYVSEMNPSDGLLLSHPPDPEFDTHPAGTHTAVATWNGDEWTDGNDWFEGAALYKHDDYWY
ncbi:MAG: hypothetical protein AAF639_09995, partial [Chloroflexota bacterium]